MYSYSAIDIEVQCQLQPHAVLLAQAAALLCRSICATPLCTFLHNRKLLTYQPHLQTNMAHLNLSGTLNILRLFANPALCLPHYTVPSFDKLPIPLSEAFKTGTGEKKPDIRALVLDKDNCFAVPHANDIYPAYQSKFAELRKAYPGSKLLIVSNTAGTGADPGHKEADLLERNTGVHVLHHTTKKPGCHAEIMDYFRSKPDSGVTGPEHVAVVGDRLFTDVMMANMMGSYGLWVRDGVVGDQNVVCL